LRRRLKNSSYTANILRLDPSDPDPDDIRKAVEIIGRKGVLVFPTTGLYGLGADAFSAEAVARVFAIKRRPAHMPVLVMLPGLDAIDQVARTVPDYAPPLMGLWPGGITLIFEAGDRVPASLTGGTRKVGVRLPAHPVAKALTETFGGPVTGTSANLTGCPAVSSLTDLDPQVGSQADLVLDAGTLAGGFGSTIVDVTRWPVRVIREGAVGRRVIDRVLRDG